MKLDKFIELYIDTNAVVRLWSKVKNGYTRVDKKVHMAHELQKDKYSTMVEVIYVTDIVVLGDSHPEAINIVIK